MFQAAGPRSNPVPPRLGRMGRSMIFSPLQGDSFAVMNSSRVPGQALSLAGFIRSMAPTIRLVTLSLSRFPDASHTVDSDKEGQERWNAKGLRIRRSPNPIEGGTVIAESSTLKRAAFAAGW